MSEDSRDQIRISELEQENEKLKASLVKMVEHARSVPAYCTSPEVDKRLKDIHQAEKLLRGESE